LPPSLSNNNNTHNRITSSFSNRIIYQFYAVFSYLLSILFNIYWLTNPITIVSTRIYEQLYERQHLILSCIKCHKQKQHIIQTVLQNNQTHSKEIEYKSQKKSNPIHIHTDHVNNDREEQSTQMMLDYCMIINNCKYKIFEIQM